METVDQEFIDAAFRFMEQAQAQGKPFFIWLNTTRMHVFTHVPEGFKHQAKAYTNYSDLHCAGMLQHDGQVLQKLDALGIEDDTVVVYSTDNGPEHSTWPHGSTTPYRSEKMTTWEGGLRVPMMVRWRGRIAARTELNGIHCGEDVFATLAAIAGCPSIKERLAEGDPIGSNTLYRCHVDGLNQMDYWIGKITTSARNSFFYYSKSHLQAVRCNQWKIHFSLRDGYYGSVKQLEIPWLFNVRQDPFESYEQAPGPRAEQSQHKSGIMNIMLRELGEHLETFKAYPPRQEATTLNIDEMISRTARANGSP
jgi:arylsulfatase